MNFDGVTDLGDNRYSKLISEGGPTFPESALVGQLFVHDEHGLCVYCHDSAWRLLQMPA